MAQMKFVQMNHLNIVSIHTIMVTNVALIESIINSVFLGFVIDLISSLTLTARVQTFNQPTRVNPA